MKSDRTQIAHLFRRAGFGATPEELDDFLIIDEENLVDNARLMGDELLAGLGELSERLDSISNVRGRGLFAAFTLPSQQMRDTFHANALDAGMLSLKSGMESIRLRPSLNISADDVAEALSIFEQTAKGLEADQVA